MRCTAPARERGNEDEISRDFLILAVFDYLAVTYAISAGGDVRAGFGEGGINRHPLVWVRDRADALAPASVAPSAVRGGVGRGVSHASARVARRRTGFRGAARAPHIWICVVRLFNAVATSSRPTEPRLCPKKGFWGGI